MALKSTVFKASLQITDLDRHYYQTHTLTVARHPSETDERLMVRLLAFARHADEQLVFGKGLSSDEEPDLWQKDLTGSIERWILVGQPEEKWLRKACGRSREVLVYCYARSAGLWWQQNRDKLEKLDNLSVIQLAQSSSQALTQMAERSMDLQCTIQDGELWISADQTPVRMELDVLHPRAA